MKKILMLVKRHPLAMLFVIAAWAFIVWHLRHDLTAFAVVVVGMPLFFWLVPGTNDNDVHDDWLDDNWIGFDKDEHHNEN